MSKGSFIDTYHNLTYKHVMNLKWFNTHCSGVKYLIKMDDDVLMNVPAVIDYLNDQNNQNKAVSGFYFGPCFLIRKGKWPVTQEEWREVMCIFDNVK